MAYVGGSTSAQHSSGTVTSRETATTLAVPCGCSRASQPAGRQAGRQAGRRPAIATTTLPPLLIALAQLPLGSITSCPAQGLAFWQLQPCLFGRRSSSAHKISSRCARDVLSVRPSPLCLVLRQSSDALKSDLVMSQRLLQLRFRPAPWPSHSSH